MASCEKSADAKVQILAQSIDLLKVRLTILHLLVYRANLLAPRRR